MSGVQHSQQTAQLLEQYSELRWACAFAVEPHEQNCPAIHVSATVQQGNTALLFRLPNDVRGFGHWLMGESHDTLGIRREWYMPVNIAGKVGEIRSTRYSGLPRPHYVRELFERPINDWSDSISGEDPFAAVSSIIWVTTEAWYSERDTSGPTQESHLLTPPVRMDVQLTLFQKPQEGWRQLYRTADPFVNVTLVGSSLIPGADIVYDPFVTALYDRFNRLCMEFQDEVWDQGLGTCIDASRSRGMSGTYGSVTLLSYIIAGRVGLTFVRGDDRFAMVGLDEVANPGLCCSSVIGTAPHLESLVREVIDFWRNADTETRCTVHKDDAAVGISF